MLFSGTKFGVGVWFILWGGPEIGYNAELYKSLNGVKNWLQAFRDVPVVRIGRAVLSESGWEEKECWRTREEFQNSSLGRSVRWT